MSRIKRLCSTALAAASLLAASSASAGTVPVEFSHVQQATIVEYRAVFGFEPGAYSEERSLGVPPQSSGVFSTTVEIPDDVDVFVAVVAVGLNGVRSAPSNERLRVSPSNLLGAPGQPVLPPSLQGK
jgi:hypothetical protein